ncbi:pilus assembly protein TadG-related protein [Streptomyces sp. NPDC002766]|uniref:pilus assembly protein TadG-related protein n=1 Tax=Streptomyces sp. NPDC002766 TaxID=3154429 RepID=UPI00332DB506
MWLRKYGGATDTGQAFPIYITVVAGLLLLAFAYVAVGQAAVNRNGAQTAADAAALAAAQHTRDELAGQWVTDVLDPTKWQDLFDGNLPDDQACARAAQLAEQNDAALSGAMCQRPELLTYTVEVTTNKPVGDSIVPGVADKRSRASATAVIDPLCSFVPPAGNAGGDTLPQLTCKDKDWKLDPKDLTDLPEPKDLFDVHLAE